MAPSLAGRGEAAAIGSRSGRDWISTSARALLDRILGVALGLLEYGAEPQDRVAIVATHGAGPLIAELAAQWAGLVVVAIDPGVADDELHRILTETEARQALVSDLPTLRRILAIRPDLPALDLVLLFERPEGDGAVPATLVTEAERLGASLRAQDPGRASRVIAAVGPDSHARWTYSNAAGQPARVVQTHREISRAIESLAAVLPAAPGTRMVTSLPVASSSLLPLQCHWLRSGGVLAFAPDASGLDSVLSEARPAIAVAEREVVEGWAVRFRASLFGATGPRRWLAGWAIQRAHARYQASNSARRVLLPSTRGEKLLDAVSLQQLRAAAAGPLDRLISVGGPLDEGVGRFLFGAGIPCYEAAVAPEVAGLLAATTPDAWKPGSAGRPVPGLELRSRAGRLEVRGSFASAPLAATGALTGGGADTSSVLTAAALPRDPASWVATSARGELDPEGFVRLA